MLDPTEFIMAGLERSRSLRTRQAARRLVRSAVARGSGQTVKLKPADPFDLIRWLARSQSDPRKAVAELVQNSIDANARRVIIERRRLRRGPSLVIGDDGEGIVPELDRDDALRAIATNIGYSRKRGLTPRERHDQVIAGKYGIGLLGFWSVGHRMEIRSRARGSPAVALRLVEDQERAEIARVPVPIGAPDTFTEIVITELHESAMRALSGRRLCEYLAAELRGPILATGVEVEIFDHLARGTSQKRFSVVPRRFAGERLNLPDTIEIPDQSPVRVELYLVRGGEGTPAIQVSCAGTLVADDIVELRSLGFDGFPWVGAAVGGLIDFPGFNVPPSTRRGVIPDQAAAAFARAMEALAPAIESELGRFERERGEAASRQVMQELKRALRGLRDRLPQYELPRVPGSEDGRAVEAQGGPLELATEETEGAPDHAVEETADESLPLFPPGPLASVTIMPETCSIAPGEERRVTAVARDADGRRVTQGVRFAWLPPDGPAFSLTGGGARPAVRAAAEARSGMTALVRVVATQGDLSAEASATLAVSDSSRRDEGGFGIPEPELVDDPNGTWRSRFDGERWQVNAAHPDYAGTRAEARTRFRYLLACLTKEIVQRTHGGIGTEPVLESFIEILSHCERNLREPLSISQRPRENA